MDNEHMDNIDPKVAAYFESVNRYLAERTRLDVNEVYEKTKCKYPVILTNTFALEKGKEYWDEDFQVICGESSVGEFFLYDYGKSFLMWIEKMEAIHIGTLLIQRKQSKM